MGATLAGLAPEHLIRTWRLPPSGRTAHRFSTRRRRRPGTDGRQHRLVSVTCAQCGLVLQFDATKRRPGQALRPAEQRDRESTGFQILPEYQRRKEATNQLKQAEPYCGLMWDGLRI
jgi:hypothetical protein